MDSAAQPNTNSTNNILPGQFVQIGEDPTASPNSGLSIPNTPSAQITMPNSAAPVGVGSTSSAPVPPPSSPLAPFMHFASPTAAVGLTSSNPAPIPPPNPSPISTPPPAPDPDSRSVLNQQPDPTPFVAPGMANTIQSHVQPPEAQKSSKGKVVILSIGVLALVSIIGAVAYLFIFNKNIPLGAKIEDTIKSQLEDLPPLPKRIQGGFADLTPISAFFTQAAVASPSATPGLESPAF